MGRHDIVLALVLRPGKLVSPEVDLLEGEALTRVEDGFALLQMRNMRNARFCELSFT